jgi:type I restriction enzyme M protein
VSKLSGFVWSIADQLRGPYHQHEYGSVILPMTILRRLDAILEPHRAHIAELIAGVDSEMRQASLVRQATGLRFYNTSKFTLKTLLKDPDGLQANLTEYVNSFSSAIDVFERFKFDEVITSLAEKDRLYLVVERFTKVDLHPDTISNSDMGDLFEDLIRRFAEASNATAGDHFTPRDAVRLVVDLMFAEDNDALLDKGAVRTVYDPTAGTGGMLSLADEHLSGQNPDARLTLYGQEFNPQSYAICKSDLLAKGHNPDNIKLGDTLSDDKFPGQTFDYCLANPPYGVDWKASEKAVKDEYNRGFAGRFGPGLPGVGDGQMLFLLHLVSKMRPASQGGGRVGVVMNGSPLFNGGAGSGQSEIRRWLLEKDLVEAIVALPTDMFFNTGISTYVWVLDNTKSAERAGKVQLVDGSGRFTKMRKSLGSKRVEISDDDRAAILADYATFETSATSKILDILDFGYWTITVERPLRLNFTCTPDRIEVVREDTKLKGTDRARLADVLGSFGEIVYHNRDAFMGDLGKHLGSNGIGLTTPQRRALWFALGERDVAADEIRDAKGVVELDPKLRDTENIPFGWNGTPKAADADGTERVVIDAYMDAEVMPHVPDARIDFSKTRVGYEIPFSYLFLGERQAHDSQGEEERFGQLETQARELTARIQSFVSSFEDQARINRWPTARIRHIATILSGSTPSADEENWGGGIWWATPVDVNASNGLLCETDRTITPEGSGSLTALPAGAVLMTSRAPIGNVTIAHIKTYFNQGCKGIVPGARITAACLAFQLMALKGVLESLGQGTTFMEINSDRLGDVSVIIPPLDWQRHAPFLECIRSFHEARRAFEELTDLSRRRRRGVYRTMQMSLDRHGTWVDPPA